MTPDSDHGDDDPPTGMDEISINHGAARLAVRRWGGRGPAMVLLHPGVGDSRIWQWCAPTWADASFHVVAYDRRGFGSTRYEEEPHDDLGDLVAVVEACGARPAVVVGNSRGGELALECALAHPDLVTALVLISPSVSGSDISDWPTTAGEAQLDELIAAADEAGDLDAVNRLEIRYWLDGADQPEGRVVGAPRSLMEAMNAQALRAPSPGPTVERAAIWPRLGDVRCPVLVVVGEHDLPGIVRECRRLAEALPSARSVVLPGAAHCPSLDQPAALSELVLDFVRDATP